jgi:hypothetical protein
MAQNTASQPSFGRVLGETARLLGKVHHRALADFGTDFPTWMLLTVLTEHGGPMTVEDVVHELKLRIDLPESDAAALLDRAVGKGHAHYGSGGRATIEPTETGTAFFAEVYAHSRAATDAAYADVEPASVDTAVSVLLAVGRRAGTILDA